MDFEHRQKIQGLDEAAIDREQQIRQLKLDLHQNSQQVLLCREREYTTPFVLSCLIKNLFFLV